jgi:hypothetical protein
MSTHAIDLDLFWRTDDGRTAAERAADYGIDLSLIEENLRLTPEQRIDQNDLVLTEVEELVAAHERTYPHYQAPR